MEKDKKYYSDEAGVIRLLEGRAVENLILYGIGLTNDSQVKFTSFSDNYGKACKTHDGM